MASENSIQMDPGLAEVVLPKILPSELQTPFKELAA